MIAARVRQASVGLRPPSACLTRHRTKSGADISIVWAAISIASRVTFHGFWLGNIPS